MFSEHICQTIMGTIQKSLYLQNIQHDLMHFFKYYSMVIRLYLQKITRQMHDFENVNNIFLSLNCSSSHSFDDIFL